MAGLAVSSSDRAFLFLMDYPNRRRIKIWGRAETIENDSDLVDRLVDPDSDVKAERPFLFHVDAWDVNARSTSRHASPPTRSSRLCRR